MVQWPMKQLHGALLLSHAPAERFQAQFYE